MADSCFTIQLNVFKKKEWEAGLHLQVIDPFLRQYNNYCLLISLFFHDMR